MSGLGVGLGPFDQLAPETALHEHAIAPDFPFVMLSVPAWWAIVDRGTVLGVVVGGASNPTAKDARAVFAESFNVAAARRRARSAEVRPATADEIASWT